MVIYILILILLNLLIYILIDYYRYKNKIINLNKKLKNEDIYLISNEFCKCKKIYGLKFKCKYCQIDNLIDFEKESDIFDLIKNINKKVKFIIHTNGGSSKWVDYLAYILKTNNVKVISYIPRYALSSGTLLTITSEKIYLNWYSVLGPVDTQLEYSNNDEEEEDFPVRNIMKVKKKENCIAKLKSMEAKEYFYDDIFLLEKLFPDEEKRKLIIDNLMLNKTSHSIKYGYDDLKEFGLPVNKNMPENINIIFNNFMNL